MIVYQRFSGAIRCTSILSRTSPSGNSMTTPIPSIPYDTGSAALPFRDQRVGLRGIGIILIIMGAIAALFPLLMPLALGGSQSLARSPARGGPPAPTIDLRMIIPAVIMY